MRQLCKKCGSHRSLDEKGKCRRCDIDCECDNSEEKQPEAEKSEEIVKENPADKDEDAVPEEKKEESKEE